MLHIPPTNLLLLAVKQEPYKKSLSLNEKYWENFLEKVQQNGPASRKKNMTERVLGLGRRTRQEIVKWNQMTTLRFQTGGETSDIPVLEGRRLPTDMGFEPEPLGPKSSTLTTCLPPPLQLLTCCEGEPGDDSQVMRSLLFFCGVFHAGQQALDNIMFTVSVNVVCCIHH